MNSANAGGMVDVLFLDSKQGPLYKWAKTLAASGAAPEYEWYEDELYPDGEWYDEDSLDSILGLV
jgi:hypothetical protein